MSEVLKIIQDESLTYKQQVLALARLAENSEVQIALTEDTKLALSEGILCDLGEGNAPYRPRYICPDYQLLFDKGCQFLELDAPSDLGEALTTLLIFYHHVPSVTSFPVYLGALDGLLEPFVTPLSKEKAKKELKNFLLQIDRTLTDSFVHANIGPYDTMTGRLILELTEEMQLAIPNLTLLYDEEKTSQEFAELCAMCMLKTAKPSFANRKMYTEDWGEDFAIASCYNALKIGGGGYTLPRLRLYEMSLKANSKEQFLNEVLPKYATIILRFMDDRIKFIHEKSAFFKSNFLVTEGFVKAEHFTGMVGVVGLAECVNQLMQLSKEEGYGIDLGANELGIQIMKKLDELVKAHPAIVSNSFNNQYRLHAQVGIDSDGRENSPGARIPIGVEPEMPVQILQAATIHTYFPTGIGDIFKFDSPWLKTPQAVVDIIKGALTSGMRYFSGYLSDNDVVRVTGYLVKKSELKKLDDGKQSLNNVSIFGKGARDFGGALDRRVQDEESAD
ncbi:MAG: YjjI family glycine radical enzyme [Anaerorhabdus sp.]